MPKASELLEKAAALRDTARRAVRLAQGLNANDFKRLTRYSEDLRAQATELEREAAAQTQRRPAKPASAHDDRQRPKPRKGRGGSSDPEPQA
jgi:hypothetical protein